MACSIDLSDLRVTQNGLRNHAQIPAMVRFVEAGGRFTRDARLAQSILVPAGSVRGTPPPMHIAVMEDGVYYLHDGHHRAVAMMLAGREFIEGVEYEIDDYLYTDYTELHPDRQWFTPFDLNTQVRRADFGSFKTNACRVYKQQGADALREFVVANRDFYLESRITWTVEQLLQTYERQQRND